MKKLFNFIQEKPNSRKLKQTLSVQTMIEKRDHLKIGNNS